MYTVTRFKWHKEAPPFHWNTVEVAMLLGEKKTTNQYILTSLTSQYMYKLIYPNFRPS